MTQYTVVLLIYGVDDGNQLRVEHVKANDVDDAYRQAIRQAQRTSGPEGEILDIAVFKAHHMDLGFLGPDQIAKQGWTTDKEER